MRQDPQDCYELELDENSEVDVESVIESAVEAVEAVETRHKGDDVSSNPGATPNPSPAANAATTTAPGAAASAAATGVAPAPPPAAEVVAAELASMRERYLRTMADFENYRKRTDREKEQLRRLATGDVIRDVLESLDNLERAVAASGSIEELKSGLQMVLRQQEDVLRRHGALRIDSLGKTFDPALHEAVMREDSASVEVPTVVAEFQRGYLHEGRLLRPALVRVAMPKAPAAPSESTDSLSAGAGEPKLN